MEAAQLEGSGILGRIFFGGVEKRGMVYKQYVQENKAFGEGYGRAHMSVNQVYLQ